MRSVGAHPDTSCGAIGEVRTPPVAAALVKRLGSFPFWRGATPFQEALEPIYTQASPRGLAVFLGESDPAAEASERKDTEALS